MSLHFVHCNFCGKQPVTGMKFYMSTCGHIACNFCNNKKLNQPQCVKCQRKVTIQQIGSDMKGKEFFMDQSKAVEKIANELDRMEQQAGDSANLETEEPFVNQNQEEEIKQLYAEADQAIGDATNAIVEMSHAYTILNRLLRFGGQNDQRANTPQTRPKK